MNFTAEKVREMAVNVRDCAWPAEVKEYMVLIEPMLRAYADSIEHAQVEVTDEVVECALNAPFDGLHVRDFRWCEDNEHALMRAALLAVWPIAAEPVARGDVDELIAAYDHAVLHERESGFLPPLAQQVARDRVSHNRNRLRKALAEPDALYRNACESVESWKVRALQAEELTDRLMAEINDMTGPTFMGEPVLPRPVDMPDADDLAQLKKAMEDWTDDVDTTVPQRTLMRLTELGLLMAETFEVTKKGTDFLAAIPHPGESHE